MDDPGTIRLAKARVPLLHFFCGVTEHVSANLANSLHVGADIAPVTGQFAFGYAAGCVWGEACRCRSGYTSVLHILPSSGLELSQPAAHSKISSPASAASS
ncbi:hypothetical protein D9619_007537 [Psilocybe cf. subviscida]|uniref:Uncharacterized protein n=1 Tax=Psilocybe cf. subviscida TaxID=2480587 RepID=A0A8H5B297_9AGAR|nr:hypothetical protein D9619_007537 [Psilocybe cf. subviscida]